MVTKPRVTDGFRGPSGRASALACAPSVLALVWSIPALAQDTGNLQNNTTVQPTAPQPAVLSTANMTTAAQAGQPQDAVTAADVSQGNAAGEGDEIVVTGLRGSLQRNLDLKRTSSGVVDVISAEDIGKFPDSNVAAALQRLPGVSIQRSGSRGEPTGITVHGLPRQFQHHLV